VSGHLTPELFREAVSRFATGLTVVSCRSQGVDHAMTASSFVSVSLAPLLVLVSVDQETRFHEAVSDAGTWAVSILPENAVATARWFATRGRPLHGQFGRVPHHRGEATGALLVDGALAALECRTWSIHPAGDHELFVGEVVDIELPDDAAPPLVYQRRGYRRLAESSPEPKERPGGSVT
jgi:flavin reductase